MNLLLKHGFLSMGVRVVIGSVWFVNGFYCKILNGVPRHEQIVAHLISDQFARPLTLSIGIAEVFLSVWVWSNYRFKTAAVVQIGLVLLMNVIEFVWAQEWLLWGRLNILFALLFAIAVYGYAFSRPKMKRRAMV